jgi:hypothetical protein
MWATLSFRWRRLAYSRLSFCSSPCPTRLNRRVSWTSSLVPLCTAIILLGSVLRAARSTLPLRRLLIDVAAVESMYLSANQWQDEVNVEVQYVPVYGPF